MLVRDSAPCWPRRRRRRRKRDRLQQHAVRVLRRRLFRRLPALRGQAPQGRRQRRKPVGRDQRHLRRTRDVPDPGQHPADLDRAAHALPEPAREHPRLLQRRRAARTGTASATRAATTPPNSPPTSAARPPAASPSSATSTRPSAGSSATSSAWAARPAAWTRSTARCSRCGRRGTRAPATPSSPREPGPSADTGPSRRRSSRTAGPSSDGPRPGDRGRALGRNFP